MNSEVGPALHEDFLASNKKTIVVKNPAQLPVRTIVEGVRVRVVCACVLIEQLRL